jgi:hypothetical protein
LLGGCADTMGMAVLRSSSFFSCSLRVFLAAALLSTSLAACSGAGANAGGASDAATPDDGGAGVPRTPAAPAPDPTRFTTLGKLSAARWSHTATLLPSGKVLVVGGLDDSGGPLASVELYDPATKSFSTLGPLPEGRAQHTATLLPTGEVLIVGGGTVDAVGVPDGLAPKKDSLVYDPTSGNVVRTASLGVARQAHTATLLASGKVLVAGGGSAQSVQEPLAGAGGRLSPVAVATASAELYDQGTNAWSAVGDLATARFVQSSARLGDGRALVVAGATQVDQQSLASAELFDPVKGQWSPTGPLHADRLFGVSALLPSGKVLVAAGKKANVAWLASTEIYDPASGTWSTSGSLAYARTGAAATPLPSGHVLVTGGDSCAASGCTDQLVTEAFDEATGAWKKGPSLREGRVGHTQTVLLDGSVLVAGGVSEVETLSTAELGTAD